MTNIVQENQLSKLVIFLHDYQQYHDINHLPNILMSDLISEEFSCFFYSAKNDLILMEQFLSYIQQKNLILEFIKMTSEDDFILLKRLSLLTKIEHELPSQLIEEQLSKI